MTINIVSIDTKPSHDPYQNIEGICSRTFLNLDPRDRTVWISQEYRTNSMSMDEWHDLILTWEIKSYPLESDMRQWLEESMESLKTICDGFESVWNGHNHVGRYSDDAKNQVAAITYELDNDGGPRNYYEYWTVASWLEGCRSEISAAMTDEELASLVENWQPTGEIVVSGDILKFAKGVRDVLREETEWEKETNEN